MCTSPPRAERAAIAAFVAMLAARAVHLGALEWARVLSTLPPKNLRGAAVESRTIFFGVGMS